MDSFWQDVRYAFRGLRQQPSFTVLAVLTLALGIGAATTMFSVIQNTLLEPLPYKESDRVAMVQIRETAHPLQRGRSAFQTPEFLDLVAASTVFEDVIGGGYENIRFRTEQGTEQLNGGLMTGNTFHFLGVTPEIGRTLTPDDSKPGAPAVFVLNYRAWSKYFNLDTSVLGKTFVINETPRTLVGVMPLRFDKLSADLYLPVVLDRADPQVNQRYFMMQAKLKPGVTFEQVQAEMSLIADRLATVYPKNYPEKGKFFVKVVSWIDNVVGGFRQTLLTLAGAVGLLLLIACANVANMLLARASAREKEIAVRSALGASRGRLVRQLLVESLLLAVMGMGAGYLFAYFGLKFLVPMIPSGAIPTEAVITLNTPVLLFSLGVAGLTALVFGLVPALQSTKLDLVESLKDGQKGGGGGFRRGKFRNTLVVVEVALSLVLLVGGGLLMRNFLQLTTTDLGFDPKNLLVVQLPFPRGQYDTIEAKQQYFRQLLPRLQQLPGVVSVTTAASLPPYGGPRSEIDITGTTHTETWNALMHLCSEDYLKTLGRRLLSGRWMTEQEVSGARRVAVVNQLFVNRYLAGQDPIGRQVNFKRLADMKDIGPEKSTFEIIGVVADVKNQGLTDAPMPEALLPFSITGGFDRGVILRVASESLSLLETVRREIWSVDRNVAASYPETLTSFLKRFNYAGPRFSLMVLGVFAVLGLLLVTLGVYSVVSYTVSRRTRDIGIRVALGATRGEVLGFVLRTGMQLVAIGIVVGVGASYLIAKVLSNRLNDIPKFDVTTLGIVVVLVVFAALGACLFPARRATKVDPIVALRCE